MENSKLKSWRLSGRIVLKLIAGRRREAERSPGKVRVVLARIRDAGARRIELCRARISSMAAGWGGVGRHTLLWLIFLLIWHPGLHMRTAPGSSPVNPPEAPPPRPGIYPVETVELAIGRGRLHLLMKGAILARYPVVAPDIPTGAYRVENSRRFDDGSTVARIVSTDLSRVFFLGAARGAEPVPSFVGIDAGHWDVVFPYLRPGTPVRLE